MQEIQNRIKGNVSNFFSEFENNKAIKVNASVSLSSTKKMVKKNKTDKLDEGDEKRKINYNLKDTGDDSNSASDSQPSDDNLDQDEMLKLIPKKYGKGKYLKGVIEEKKKKKAPPQTEVKPKKPKIVLMPCMSNKKDKE